MGTIPNTPDHYTPNQNSAIREPDYSEANAKVISAFDKLMALRTRTGIRSLRQLLDLSNAMDNSTSDADIKALIKALE